MSLLETATLMFVMVWMAIWACRAILYVKARFDQAFKDWFDNALAGIMIVDIFAPIIYGLGGFSLSVLVSMWVAFHLPVFLFWGEFHWRHKKRRDRSKVALVEVLRQMDTSMLMHSGEKKYSTVLVLSEYLEDAEYRILSRSVQSRGFYFGANYLEDSPVPLLVANIQRM